MVEVKSRGGYLMGLTSYGNYSMEDTADFTVYVPRTDEHFMAVAGGGASAADGLLCVRGQEVWTWISRATWPRASPSNGEGESARSFFFPRNFHLW